MVGMAGCPWDEQPVAPILMITMAGTALMLATWRTVEHCRFTNRAGQVAVDIACSGPEASSFAAFITVVAQQVGSARERAALPRPPPPVVLVRSPDGEDGRGTRLEVPS
jgi:hypothetical protein